MSVSVSRPFTIESTVVRPTASINRNIFQDVELAKGSLLELRRSGRRRAETAARNGGQVPENTSTVDQSQSTLALVMGSVLQAETELLQVKSLSCSLELRKAGLEEAMRKLRHDIGILKANNPESRIHSQGEHQPNDDLKTLPPGKRRRYFEPTATRSTGIRREESAISQATNEDLSSVVCPFELMGTCTDPGCPHMHLSR
jgi:hypothetical protein